MTRQTHDTARIVYTGTRPPKTESNHLEIHHVPALEVTPVSVDREHLTELVARADHLVCYSRNAVDCISAESLLDHTSLENKYFWAVGPKTASHIKQKIGKTAETPEPEDGYNFEGLVGKLEKRLESDEIVVSFELKGTSRILAEKLNNLETTIHSETLYKTNSADRELFWNKINTLRPDGIAFTSPKGVRAILQNLTPQRRKLLDRAVVGAIGPKTSASVKKFLDSIDVTLDNPDKTSLVEHIGQQFLSD